MPERHLHDPDSLTPAERAIFVAGDQVNVIELRQLPGWDARLHNAAQALARRDTRSIEAALQGLIDQLCEALAVATVSVRLVDEIPFDQYGPLHGYYEPTHAEHPAKIVLCTVSVARRRLGYNRLLDHLLHELTHHLDLTLFGLPMSFHTPAFYRRQRSLRRQLDRARESTRQDA